MIVILSETHLEFLVFQSKSDVMKEGSVLFVHVGVVLQQTDGKSLHCVTSHMIHAHHSPSIAYTLLVALPLCKPCPQLATAL